MRWLDELIYVLRGRPVGRHSIEKADPGRVPAVWVLDVNRAADEPLPAGREDVLGWPYDLDSV
jgi:hypothetical protein